MATNALLEREAELETIEALLAAALDGSGQLLTIEGEAGAGKTSLLGAAGRLAAARGMRVLRARGGEYERDFPYGVVRQLFEPMLMFDADQRAELLAGSAALAAPVFDLQAARRADTDPLAIQHGLYWLAADLAASSPTVLLVDDAQWADLASLRAFVYTGRRLEGLPMLVAFTVRTGEPGGHEELLDQLRDQPPASLIEPAPLSVQATRDLTAAEVGARPSEKFAGTCREATAGNPFLLVQLLRSLDRAQLDSAADRTAELIEKASAGVSRSILSRLGKLGEHSVTVARAVAVLEPNAETRLVTELAGLTESVVAESFELLIRARLLSDSRPVAFVHPLVREVVLSEVATPRRAADHSRAAQLLDRDGTDPDAVAAHLLLAEHGGEAWVVEALRRAAAGALGRGAPEAAVRYLRRALQEPPTREQRLDVSRELGIALLRANDPEGIEVLRTVRAATEDPAAHAQLSTELAGSLGLRGGAEEAAVLLEESLARQPDPDGEIGLMLRAWLLLEVIWGLERLPEGALPSPGEEIANDTIAGRALLAQAATLSSLGLDTAERGLKLAEKSIPSDETVIEDALAGIPHQGTFSAFILVDQAATISHSIEVSLEASKRRGASIAVAGAHGMRAFFNLLDGDLRGAAGDAEIAVGIVEQLQVPSALAVWLAASVRLATARGEMASAEGMLVDLESDRARVTGLPAAILLCARGELRRETGRYVEARNDYLAASERMAWLPLANQEVFPWRIGLALCEAALGNEEKGRQLAAEALEIAHRAGGERGIGIALRVQGAVTPGPEGIELLRKAVDVLAGTRARLHHAQALVELGAALRRANQRKDAREPLRQGLDLAHRYGAKPLEEQARTELEATGARPRKAVYSGVESLTPSELRVARMAAGGKTNREIAQSLTVTEKTIETHMRHVFQKLDLSSRTELAGALTSD